jgi:hypothetical protein
MKGRPAIPHGQYAHGLENPKVAGSSPVTPVRYCIRWGRLRS